MYQDIYIGIDGTGPYSSEAYMTQFENSFVKTLVTKTALSIPNNAAGKQFYIPGPKNDGLITGMLARLASVAAELHFNTTEKSPLKPMPRRIFMTGYSRGGAAAIEACHALKAKGIAVHGLLLFDAVDRTNTIENTKIPSNVAYCAHAIRSPQTRSRDLFGNCGTKYDSSVQYHQNYFYTTHGGMGGTPWGKEGEVNGKINERMFEITPQFSGGPALGLLTYAAGRLNDATFQTNVSADEEAKGADMVWNWMLAKFKAFHQAKPRAEFKGIDMIFSGKKYS